MSNINIVNIVLLGTLLSCSPRESKDPAKEIKKLIGQCQRSEECYFEGIDGKIQMNERMSTAFERIYELCLAESSNITIDSIKLDISGSTILATCDASNDAHAKIVYWKQKNGTQTIDVYDCSNTSCNRNLSPI